MKARVLKPFTMGDRSYTPGETDVPDHRVNWLINEGLIELVTEKSAPQPIEATPEPAASIPDADRPVAVVKKSKKKKR